MKHPDELWKRYENGTITDAEQRELEEHIEGCPVCEARLHRLLAEESGQGLAEPVPQLKQSLRRAKWRQRLTHVLWTLGALLLLYASGTLLTSLYYMNNDTHTRESVHLPSMAVQAMLPGVRVDGGGSNANVFFRMHSSFHITRQVGKENTYVGTVDSDMRFSAVRSIDVNWNSGVHTQKLQFAYPGEQVDEQGADATRQVWTALEKLPEGTVAEVALSFDKSYDVTEVRDSLLYGVYGGQETTPAPTWFALDTGVEGTPSQSEMRGPYLGEFEVFGFPNELMLPYQDNDSNLSEEDRVVAMLKLFSENEKAFQKVPYVYEQNLQLKQRYNYVKKNGVHVYGAVVTGPVKELLKLREAKFVRFAALGETALWNWIDRPGSSIFF